MWRPDDRDGVVNGPSVEPDPVLWVRVGGGFEEVPGGGRHGPADPENPPPLGPWDEVRSGNRLVGWCPAGCSGRALVRRAEEEGERIAAERRAHLMQRLGHKLRSAVLVLQESARQAAYGRQELLEEVYEQAVEVGRRAAGLETVALEPKDVARSVVLGAVLNLAAPAAARTLPGDAVVRAPEPVLVEALTRAYEWMGGPGSSIHGERAGGWWRLELLPAPGRQPLAVPELGEPLVRLLVDDRLDAWLDAGDPGRALIYLPAV